MIAIDYDFVQEIQKKYLKFLESQRIDALNNLSAIDKSKLLHEQIEYIDKVIEVFKNKKDSIITADKNSMEKLIESVGEIPTSKRKETKDIVLKALKYSELRSSFYPSYFNVLGINACVYCNSQLTIVARKNDKNVRSAKYQLDHYHAKSKYPFLSISLFNLYPVCGSCNLSKGVKDVDFDLYIKDKMLTQSSLYSFKLTDNSLSNYLLNKKKEFIVVKFHEPQVNKVKGRDNHSFEELFHVQGIYNTQKDLAEELIVKSQMYNEKYIETLQSSFSSLKLNPSLFKRTIVGNYTEDKDIHKRPMSKFTMDIARQLGLIDKIK